MPVQLIMETPRRLSFSFHGGVGDDDSEEHCTPLTRRTSLRKAASTRPASDAAVEEYPNRKNKKQKKKNKKKKFHFSKGWKFRLNTVRIKQRKNHLFTRSTDSQAFFEVSMDENGNDNGAENKTVAGQESHDRELCALHDAFETMMSQGLSEYQKKLQLKNLMELENEKRKELSNEWVALCAEERKLNIKKLRIAAKLVEATFDE